MLNKVRDCPGLIDRIKYIYIFAIALAVVLGGYMLFVGVSSITVAANTERVLRSRRAESVQLSAQVKHVQTESPRFTSRRSTGVEAFAVQISAAARAHHVSIESFAPEGVEGTASVDFDNTALGEWATNKVNVKGRGQYDQVMNVIEGLCTYSTPLKLESLSLDSVDSGISGAVQFQITVTVYRRKSGAA